MNYASSIAAELMKLCYPEELRELREGRWNAPGQGKPEGRMVKTMANAAQRLGLVWRRESPADHPCDARLDGELLQHGKRIAVVELSAQARKQTMSALLDLLTYPEPKRILVLGRAKNPETHNLVLTKINIVGRILPALEKSFRMSVPEVGVFTEDGLILNPNNLGKFLGL